MVGDLFSAFVLTRTISEDSFAKYPVSDPSQRLSSRGQSLRDPSPLGGSLQRTRLVPPKMGDETDVLLLSKSDFVTFGSFIQN